MTYLELVNETLKLMRVDQVATVTENDYSTLIGALVNQAKKKVENAADWHRFNTTIQITTVAGSYGYTLTGAGKRYKLLQRQECKGWDVYNDTEDWYLFKAPSSAVMSKWLNSNDAEQNDPSYFDINGYDSNHDPIINFYPVPSTSGQKINVAMWIPQADLTNDSDILVVPDLPVQLLAYQYALRERGEDSGTFYQEAKEDAREALADAIAMDLLLYPEELTWRPE